MSPLSIIIDLETLSTDPNCVITEIGAIAFLRDTFKPVEFFDHRPLIFQQIADFRQVDPDTIRWAEKKGTLPKNNGAIPIAQSLRRLSDFIERHKPARIWAWGKDFERPIIENAYRQYGIQMPEYQFRKFSCARDHWQSAFGMETRPAERPHHALEDCKMELLDLKATLEKLNIHDAA